MKIPCASIRESALIFFRILLPVLLKGLFLRRRHRPLKWVGIDAGKGNALLERLRRKYRSPLLKLWFPRNTYLVFDSDARKSLLRYSPVVFDAARGKRRGMNVFQPGAVTIAPADLWQPLREVNERSVGMAVADRLSPLILDRVKELTGILPIAPGRKISFDEFDDFFEMLSAQLFFGRMSLGISRLFETLRQMMREANQPYRRKTSRKYPEFARRLYDEMAHVPPDSIIGAALDQNGITRCTLLHQIPHWMFALRDTLLLNVVQALILLAQHPDWITRIRERLGSELTVAGIRDTREIEWCVLETMRLWPTTPILARRSRHELPVTRTILPRQCEFLIVNDFNHRDAASVPDPHRFRPDRWQFSDVSWQFNFLSNGPQGCAGRDLALRIANTVIAVLFTHRNVTCLSPTLQTDEDIPSSVDLFAACFRLSAVGASGTADGVSPAGPVLGR